MNTEVLLRLHSIPDIQQLEVYRQNGGYEGLLRASRLSSQEILAEVERAGLRGRGGAGFPTHIKWQAAAAQERRPHYLICNAAEGEPGSFKDRELLKNPHQVLEATAISAYAIGAEKAFVYLRGLFHEEEKRLVEALEQTRHANLLGSRGLPVDLIVHRGEENYIAGEETALLESLEGKPAIPRTKPPRPHEEGLWGCPTVVNNVETLCNIIYIVLHGSKAFRSYGTEQSPGTKLFCLSGQIRNPGLYELPMGIRLSELLNNYGGGPRPGRTFRAVFPGGPSTPIVPYVLDPAMDFEGLQAVGSTLGTGGIIVLDDSTDLNHIARETAHFFARESCGACPPCTIGTAETHRLFQKLSDPGVNRNETVLKIREFCEMMKFRGQCAHCSAAALTHLSLLNLFPEISRSNSSR